MPDQVEGSGEKPSGGSVESNPENHEQVANSGESDVKITSVHHHFIHHHSEIGNSENQVVDASSSSQPQSAQTHVPIRTDSANVNDVNGDTAKHSNNINDDKNPSNQDESSKLTSNSNQEENSESMEGEDDEKNEGKKLGGVKKDRTNLRKGKWTVSILNHVRNAIPVNLSTNIIVCRSKKKNTLHELFIILVQVY